MRKSLKDSQNTDLDISDAEKKEDPDREYKERIYAGDDSDGNAENAPKSRGRGRGRARGRGRGRGRARGRGEKEKTPPKNVEAGWGALFETRELSGAQRTSCKPKEKEGRGNVDSFIESVRNLKQRLWATRLRRTAVRRQRRSRKGQLRPGVGVVFCAICQEPKEKAGSRKKKKDVETRTRSSNRPGT